MNKYEILTQRKIRSSLSYKTVAINFMWNIYFLQLCKESKQTKFEKNVYKIKKKTYNIRLNKPGSSCAMNNDFPIRDSFILSAI